MAAEISTYVRIYANVYAYLAHRVECAKQNVLEYGFYVVSSVFIEYAVNP